MSRLTYEYWRAKARDVQFRNLAFIDGSARTAQSGHTYGITNPATGRRLTEVAACDRVDADLAVSSARNAFESGVWSGLAPSDRKVVIMRMSALIMEHREELALLECLDMGKPVMDAYNVDIPGAAATLAWYGEVADKIYDEVAPTGPGAVAMISREPIGVVAAVVPWNFPLDLAVWKLGPALAAGNSIIVKPAEQTPHSVLRLAELAIEAGIPEGVFNVTPGLGQDIGQALGRHNGIDCLTFTGSTPTGKKLLKYSAESNMKPVWLELGGKSPNLIFSDCGDMEKAADMAAFGIFANQGEVCSAVSRLLVENTIKEEFLELLVERASRVVMGDPLDPSTTMGPVAGSEQAEKVERLIQKGKDEGARLTYGGSRRVINGSDLFIEPTIFDGVCNTMTIAREEIFGPVLSVIGFDTEQQAIEIANDTPYGLAAAVWTDDLSRAHQVAGRLRAGTVSVNTVDALSPMTPFGGFKQSGFGRDLSVHAFDKFTQLKTTWIQLK